VTDLRVSPLSAIHRSRIEEIVRACGVFSDEEVAVALEVFDTATAATAAVPADYELLGAFDGDHLLGYACFGPTPSTDRTYDLYWIAVHPDAQRSGVGAALMTEAERQLEARRARLVIIETSSRDDYVPTRRFYEKRGYVEAARLRDFYAPGDDRLVLSKRFGSSGPNGNAAVPSLTA
jgi:ribosomal protein S18 acetylase RimI-like enzyme